MRTWKFLATIACFALLAAPGHAAVVDFDAATPGAWADLLITTYDEAGFRFSVTNEEAPFTYFFPDVVGNYLYQDQDGLALTITAVGGQSFTFVSFATFSASAPTLLDLTGNLTGGGTIDQIVTVNSDSSTAMQTILLGSAWTNLDSVVISRRNNSGEGDSTDFGYDNFNLQIDEAAVPEPGTLVLWSLGALGCALAGQKRARRRLA